MATVDYAALGRDIVSRAGGKTNIATVGHCATRLRLTLKDGSLASKAVIEKLPGVITVVEAGGQFQVVVGNNVEQVYDSVRSVVGTDVETAPQTDKGSPLQRFIALVSALFTPIMWPLAGTALLKAFLTLFTQVGWLTEGTGTHTILSASADALFYFLPMLLAVTAAKHFRANQFTSLALAGALIYPNIVALAGQGDPVTFFGLPVTVMNYAGSVIPVLVTVWLQSHFERGLNRILPHWLRNFTTPLLTVLILVPFVLLTVGPLTMSIAVAISSGVMWLFSTVPWLGGAALGGTWQALVVFGLHWGIIPLMLNDISTLGSTVLFGPVLPAGLAQAGATTAVLLRSRSAKRRTVAGSAIVSAYTAGITEPAIYGVNLPLKRPFYFGLLGGAVGGAIAAMGGSAATTMIFPSLLALPAFLQVGNFTQLLVGTGVAIIIAFLGTWFFVDRETPDEVDAEDEPVSPGHEAAPVVQHSMTRDAATHDAATHDSVARSATIQGTMTAMPVTLGAPMAGRTTPLSEVPDPVFSGGKMGPGVGIEPTSGDVHAPADGQVIVVPRTGHAVGLRTSDGVEILIHVGIDTVQMNGDGFHVHVAKGAQVHKGDLLISADLHRIRAAGHPATTVMLVTNAARYSAVDAVADRTVEAGADMIEVKP